jgi:hypothetical protein
MISPAVDLVISDIDDGIEVAVFVDDRLHTRLELPSFRLFKANMIGAQDD